MLGTICICIYSMGEFMISYQEYLCMLVYFTKNWVRMLVLKEESDVWICMNPEHLYVNFFHLIFCHVLYGIHTICITHHTRTAVPIAFISVQQLTFFTSICESSIPLCIYLYIVLIVEKGLLCVWMCCGS